MRQNEIPDWFSNLSSEDAEFIKKFLLTSGSLKEIAVLYSVSYPTVRLRLDRLIEKIELNDNKTVDPYIEMIKDLALNQKIDFDTAKLLIDEYKKEGQHE